MDNKPKKEFKKGSFQKDHQDAYMSPKSVNRKIANINTEFKKKMEFSDSNSNMVFDFEKGHYVKKDLLDEYDTYKSTYASSKNKNTIYNHRTQRSSVSSFKGSEDRNITERTSGYTSSNNVNTNIPGGKVRNLINTFNDRMKSSGMDFKETFDATSILSSRISRTKASNIKTNIFSPINIMYTPKQPMFNPNSMPRSPVSKPKQQKSEKKTSSFYGPGEPLVHPITFSIHNTVYNFEDGRENTIYYIKISSSVTWMIRKTFKEIKSLLIQNASYIGHSYRPYDKNIRDRVIETILNNNSAELVDKIELKTNDKLSIDKLQYFMLSGIVNDITYRSSYLLMEETNLLPFSFRLVGKALVCYDSNNRVFKIFLLEKCRVEEYEDISFILYSDTGSVKLYTSCKLERDQWIKDINEFILSIK